MIHQIISIIRQSVLKIIFMYIDYPARMGGGNIMTVTPMSQPFDLSMMRGGGRLSGVIELTIAIAIGLTGFLHFKGYFQLPADFAILPFDELCAGFALLIFLSGIVDFFRFRGYRIDPLKKTIQQVTRGVFGTRYGQEIFFNNISHVQIVREVHGTPDTAYLPVYIHLKSGDLKQVFKSDRYSIVRGCGEKLAKLINVDIHDTEAGVTQVRKPEGLDETVREKLRKQSSHQISPNTPPRMHAKIKSRFESLVIDIPRFDITHLGAINKLLWVLFTVFPGWTAVALYFESYLLAFIGAFFWVIPLNAMLRSETITLTRDTFAVRSGIGLFKITQRIPLAELEELYLSNATQSEREESGKLLKEEQVSKDWHTLIEFIVALGAAIVVRSDRKSITFGRILSHEELNYILYQIERRIRN